MKRALSSTVLAAVALALTVVLTGHTGTSPWPVAAVGVVAGLAYAVGAWCAPLFQSGRPLGGTLFTGWRRAWDSPKATQVLIGAGVAVAFTIAEVFAGASAVSVGLIAALVAGFLLPVPEDAAHSEDAERA